jgi:hypothetical protein
MQLHRFVSQTATETILAAKEAAFLPSGGGLRDVEKDEALDVTCGHI